jgi:hypothetical protein
MSRARKTRASNAPAPNPARNVATIGVSYKNRTFYLTQLWKNNERCTHHDCLGCAAATAGTSGSASYETASILSTWITLRDWSRVPVIFTILPT